jgi:PKHD-type hydroxylase
MSGSDPSPIYASGNGAFTAEELDRLERHCDGLALIESALGGPQGGYRSRAIRVTRIAAIAQAPAILWFYERLAVIIHEFNSRSFAFDLTGLSEAPQYMVYRGQEGGHFDWHMDTGSRPPRKLSLTIQLSDPSRYEGCELQFNAGTEISTAPKDRGAAIAFASHTLHRVTPIVSGTRKAIVAWVTGPKFR